MDTQDLFIQMALHGWNTQISRAGKLIDALTDEQLQLEVSPGRNRVIYLLGHLIAVNDGMLSLFGIGARQYAQLDEAFIKHADRSGIEQPDAAALRRDWKQSNDLLDAAFKQLSAEDWLGAHTAISAADFAKEPTRNKLNVLLGRTNHLAYHLGQMNLAKPRLDS